MKFPHRCAALLPLCLLACAGACSFDPTVPVAAGEGEDAAPPDAQVFFDDGGLISPDAAPGPDAPPPAAPCSEAPFIARAGSTHRYYLQTDKMNYDEAQASCMATGAHLVVVNDPDEDVFVVSLGGTDHWIGFDDLDIEDVDDDGSSFAWVNGESPGHSNWKTNEPNDGPMDDEDCAILKGGFWEDHKCGEARESVCECDPANEVAPAPACMTNSAYSSVGVGRRYRYNATPTTYADAQISCAADGAHLVVIADDKENAYVDSISTSNTWIGLNDITSEGDFDWVTGSASDYENWAEDSEEPNGGSSENCAELRASGEWNDEACTDLDTFVCECDPLYVAIP